MKDKIIVVTGAAHGLGKGFIKSLVHLESKPIALDVDESGLLKLKKKYSDLITYTIDIGDENKIRKLAGEILEKYPVIDGLINNAGVSHTGKLEELDMQDFEWVIRTNLIGTVLCTKFFLPGIRNAESGFIANISSGIAFQGLPGFSAYAASKSAIKTFSESIRAELFKDSIQVSCVFPGPIKTNISTRSRHVHLENRRKEVSYLHEYGQLPEILAGKILTRIMKGKTNILAGRSVWWGSLLKRIFPNTFDRLIAVFQKKLPV